MEILGMLFMGGAASAAGSAGAVSMAGGAAASAAAGFGTAAAGASTLTLLQGVGTVFSALATIGGGAAAASAANAQAEEQEFEASNEFIRGKETSAALKRELARTVGNQAVAFAAGGVDLGSVSVQQAKAQAVKDAETELSVASNDALLRSMQRRRAARNIRAQGRASTIGALASAGGQIAQFGLDAYQRGV